MNKTLVIGGSGVLGSALVHKLQTESANFLTASRSPFKTNYYSTVNQTPGLPWTRVDLTTGEGLIQALADVDTVFHLASSYGKIGRESVEVVITRNLLTAIRHSDVKHLIYSSIVGVDKIPFNYYRAKLDAEVLICQSPVPYTILRATQFHNLIDFALGKLLRLPIGFVPKKLVAQPIQVEVVAQELYRLAQSGSQQAILTLGGPQVLDAGTLAQRWMQYRNVAKPIMPIPVVGTLMKAFAKGYHTYPQAAVSAGTWEDYLTERYGQPARSTRVHP